jgi:Tfp pilus assembly protein PilE
LRQPTSCLRSEVPEAMNNHVDNILSGVWIFLGIIFLSAVAMAIFSGMIQRHRAAARNRQLLEASQRMRDHYKQMHEEGMEAAARQTALLEKILAALERGNGREGIKQP